ncbi:MAG: hypothetical protein ACHQ6T_00955 [Myxococcota bacterium]
MSGTERARRLLRAALCALAFAALGACDQRVSEPAAAPPPVDEDLAVLIPSLVDSIQAKQPAFLMDHVAQSFKEERGLDYFDVRALVERFAYRDDAVGARLESSEVTPDSDGRQRVSARVAFALGQRLAPGAVLPDGAVVYALELVFAKNGPRWQAVRGRYDRVVPPATSAATPSTTTR